MTADEFIKERAAIDAEHKQKTLDLLRRYAFSHNDVKKGDKFTDHIGTIIVEQIKVCGSLTSDFPSCVYFGPELKKDGTPKKNGDKRWAYQTNKVKA